MILSGMFFPKLGATVVPSVIQEWWLARGGSSHTTKLWTTNLDGSAGWTFYNTKPAVTTNRLIEFVQTGANSGLWVPFSTDRPVIPVQSLDPANPDAGTSYNPGDYWNWVEYYGDGLVIGALRITNPGRLRYSLDAGLTWNSYSKPYQSVTGHSLHRFNGLWIDSAGGSSARFWSTSSDYPWDGGWTSNSLSDGAGTILVGASRCMSIRNTTATRITTTGTSWSVGPSFPALPNPAARCVMLGDTWIVPVNNQGGSGSNWTRVMRTEDAGSNWDVVDVSSISSNITKLVHMPGTDSVAACVSNITGSLARAYISHDMGQTWSTLSLPFTPSSSEPFQISPVIRPST